MLITCGRHFLDVITYASHDPLSLALIMLGTWALFNGREAVGGLWLAIAAAIRASPLIYLPYLILKRRLIACGVFLIALLGVSAIPDVIGALRGGYTGHLTDWLGQVVGPALVPGNSSELVFWDIWNGANLYNQSLRGLINRFATGPVLGLTPTTILIVVDGIFAAIVGVPEGIRGHRHGGAPDRDAGAFPNDQPLSSYFCAAGRHFGDRSDHSRPAHAQARDLCTGGELPATRRHFKRYRRPATDRLCLYVRFHAAGCDRALHNLRRDIVGLASSGIKRSRAGADAPAKLAPIARIKTGRFRRELMRSPRG